MRLHPTFYVGRLKPYTQHEPSNLDGSQKMTKRREPASRARQHGCNASRPAFQVPLDVRRSLRDLRLHIAQLLLQLDELRALEMLQRGYTPV
ncbi:hypothetical protein PC129_g25232 [Phytophthora cactorum]|uniref:Uncharacterized protein n=1 Tax=Phytophthora cactorum TaxID=29920 RepID=A0A8T0Y8W3_9STRA|nr:hypothetical protein PC112_g23447 [Phytophthora cactorum]KAG2814903.1 hypothetical protein PC113_g23265 [Phytophthora cactorum]KAG2877848.1 hypothetical protein PC115_g23242 [Phytophthora cactorum]KAG2880133.1 hypothetical protein PC117_g26633 [Phytophthora cactorum]KAG2945095.1 hypothetical protein PC118_g25797 [Phytophthora cactorum]